MIFDSIIPTLSNPKQHSYEAMNDLTCAIAIVQEDTIVYVNPAFLNLAGFREEKELIGKELSNIWKGRSSSLRTTVDSESKTQSSLENPTRLTTDQFGTTEVFEVATTYDGKPAVKLVIFDGESYARLDPNVRDLLDQLKNNARRERLTLEATTQKLDEEQLSSKEVREALAELESRYRHIIELSPSAIMIISNGSILASNSAAAMMLQIENGESLEGSNVVELFAPDCRDAVKYAINTPNYYGKLPDDHILVRKDGSYVDAEVFVAQYPGDESSISYVIIRDISSRKQVERALKLAEERTQFALDASGIGVWDWHPQTNESYFSKTWKSMIGYEEDEIQSHQDEWTSRVHPDDWDAIYQAENRMMQGETANYECVYRLRSKDGSYKWILSCGRPVTYDENGKPTRYIGTHTDLTDRIEAEERIERLNKDLSARNHALEAANHELETFSYTVSHDLRSPLRTIDGYSHAIEYDYGDELSDGAKDYLRAIRRATQNLGHLIDDILSLSRINQSPLKLQNINLSIIAEEISRDTLTQSQHRNIEFEIKSDLNAVGDRNLIQIALQNLIGNAVKFSAAERNSKITVGKTGQAFYVRDNGVGFNMQHANKLFEPFQRLHSTQEFEGSGIGLATVARIVRRHGGRIWAESQKDQGATFYFTLNEAGG